MNLDIICPWQSAVAQTVLQQMRAHPIHLVCWCSWSHTGHLQYDLLGNPKVCLNGRVDFFDPLTVLVDFVFLSGKYLKGREVKTSPPRGVATAR
eukprot:1591044-Amphidinium_carterae.1